MWICLLMSIIFGKSYPKYAMLKKFEKLLSLASPWWSQFKGQFYSTENVTKKILDWISVIQPCWTNTDQSEINVSRFTHFCQTNCPVFSSMWATFFRPKNFPCYLICSWINEHFSHCINYWIFFQYYEETNSAFNKCC